MTSEVPSSIEEHLDGCGHKMHPLRGPGGEWSPWHGTCFNIANGDIEDSLPCYRVNVEDGKVKVRATRKDFFLFSHLLALAFYREVIHKESTK